MNFAVIDIEANNWVNFLIGGIYYKNKNEEVYKEALKAKDLFSLILESKKTEIYAHNGGKYDFNFFLDLMKDKYLFDIAILQGRMMFIKVYDKNHKYLFTFIDSMNFLKGSLESISKNILGITEGKNKLKSYENLKINKELRDYLYSDCKILYTIIDKFFEKFYKGVSIGSISQKTFFKDFTDGKNFNFKPRYLEDYIRDNFYFGGKVEIYKKQHQGDIYVYDVNSLYPYCMKENFYPLGDCFKTNKEHVDKLGFYEIEIKNGKTLFDSVIPYKYMGKLYFISPEKGNVLFLDSIALKFLRENKISYKIKTGIVFEKKGKIFTKFVNHFYKMRKQDKQNSLFYKLILNNLYGKFAMKREREVISNYIPERVKEFFGYGEKGYILYNIQLESKNIFPEISCLITSYSRYYMHRLIDRFKDNILYSDTDSLILNCEIPENLISQDEIGKLKFEGHFKKFITLAPKVYALKNGKTEKVVFKGFNSSHITYQDLVDYSEKGKQIKEKRTVLKNAIKQEFSILETEKSLISENNKRDITKNICLTISQIKG